MEIQYYEKINKRGRLTKYAKFNGIIFGAKKDSSYYGNSKHKLSLHHAVYCYYNNLEKIPEGYHVHHKDENPLNNDISNLQLLTHGEHSTITQGNRKRDPLSEETKLKLSNSVRGRKLTEEHKKKISEANSGENNGMYGKESWNKGKHSYNKGKEMSDEQKQKISIANKGKNKGRTSPRKGVKLTEELKQKMSESRKGINSGKDNYQWKEPTQEMIEDVKNKIKCVDFCKKHNCSYGIWKRTCSTSN